MKRNIILLVVLVILIASVVLIGVHPIQHLKTFNYYYSRAYAFDPTLAGLRDGINITWTKGLPADGTIIKEAPARLGENLLEVHYGHV